MTRHLSASQTPAASLPSRWNREFRVSAHECMLDLNPDIVVLCVGVSSHSVNVKEHALRHNGSDLLVVQPHFFLSFCSLTSHFSSVRHPVITSFHHILSCFLLLYAEELIRKTNFPSGKPLKYRHTLSSHYLFLFFNHNECKH